VVVDSGLDCDDEWVEGAGFGCWNGSGNRHGLGGAMAPAVAAVPRLLSVSAAENGADAEIEAARAAVVDQCAPLGLSLPLLGPDMDDGEEGAHSRVLTTAMVPTVTNWW
jgi:hypothetical protein